jgi:hypothetical protein
MRRGEGANTLRRRRGRELRDAILLDGEEGARVGCRWMDKIEDCDIPYSKTF